MLKLVTFVVLLALARSEGVHEFVGEWITVKVYPLVPGHVECEKTTVATTKKSCKCGSKSVPMMMLGSPGKTAEAVAVTVVTNKADAVGLVDQTCKCDGGDARYLPFRYLNGKYFFVYGGTPDFFITVLMAKEIPTWMQLQTFEKSIPELKTQEGFTVCVKEALEPGENH